MSELYRIRLSENVIKGEENMTLLDSHMVPKFVSVKKASELYEWPVGGLRHLIFTNTDFNNIVVKRVGRKVMLDLKAMEEWISSRPR